MTRTSSLYNDLTRSDIPPELVLNGVPLVIDTSETVGGAGVDVLEDGTELASPEAIVQAIASWTGEGQHEWVEGYDNLAHQLRVMVRGADIAELDANTARLLEACRAGELVWTPPHMGATPAVYRVQWVKAKKVWSGVLEGTRLRTYALEARCLPYAYARSAVSVPVVPSVTPSPTTLDDLSGTRAAVQGRGWDAFGVQAGGGVTSSLWGAVPDDCMTVSSGTLRCRVPDGFGPGDFSAVRVTRPVSSWPSSKRLIRTTLTGNVSALYVSVNAGAGVCDLVMRSGNTWWHRVPGDVVGIVDVRWQTPGAGARLAVQFDDVSWVDVLPAVGSDREILGTVTASGTARTAAALVLEPVLNFGSQYGVLVHAWAETGSGYAGPNVSQHRATGTWATEDTANTRGLSGSYVSIGSQVRWDIPATRLPEATYELWVLARRSAGAGIVPVTIAAGVANPLQPSPTLTPVATVHRSFPGPTYQWVSLGSVTLPSTAVAADGATQRLALTGAGIRVDQVCLTLQELSSRPDRRAGGVVTCWAPDEAYVSITPPSPDRPGARVMGWLSEGGEDTEARAVASVGALDDLTLRPGPNAIYACAAGAIGGIQGRVTYTPAGIDVPPAAGA